MRIKKTYEENVNLGNYQSARVGIEITYDKDVSQEELLEVSNKLGQIAKKAVQNELEIIKKEKEQN